MHKYSNQDIAIMNAMLAARSTLAGARLHELWNGNEDAPSHEAGYAGMRRALDSICLLPTNDSSPRRSKVGGGRAMNNRRRGPSRHALLFATIRTFRGGRGLHGLPTRAIHCQ